MVLKDRTAIVYGGGGAIGSTVARAFAQAGANVFLAGRSQARLEKTSAGIRNAGGSAEWATVDALDEEAVTAHAANVAAKTGSIDIAFNAVGLAHVQGVPFTSLTAADFLYPVTAYARTYFITAQAAARHMKPGGVIMMLSTPGSKMAGTGFFGYGVSCAATEAMTRLLAAELGAAGIRAVCIRPHAIPQAAAAGSHSRDVFEPAAKEAGITVTEMLEGAAQTTLIKRLPTLDEVAQAAVFAASSTMGSMTGAVINLSGGVILD